jgi:cyclopropane fatty-acyl-phospholipid synthase-like methyltransferase
LKAGCGQEMSWHNCYSGAHDIWVPEAYSHPAKMAPGLCQRILAHLKELGLLSPADTILDFMCGVGTTLILGALQGNSVVGVYLLR